METTADTQAAKEALEDARRKLDQARLDLKRFQEVEMPTEIAEGQLGIERSMQNLGEARQELAQMEAMYATEANLDASMVATRDMVLERHRKRVEFSTRSLEIARTKFQDEVGSELPSQQRKLEAGLREAERGVRDAEHDVAKDGIESQRALGKAKRAITEAERKLTKVQAGDKGEGAADEDEDSE